MRIQLLKPLLVGTVNRARGEVVEVDDQRGKALVKKGCALKVTVTGPERPSETEPVSEPVPDQLELRQAVANPAKRKSRPRKAD